MADIAEVAYQAAHGDSTPNSYHEVIKSSELEQWIGVMDSEMAMAR